MTPIRCPLCRSGVTVGKSTTGKPEYTCTRCGHVWTRGYGGERPEVWDAISKLKEGR